MSRESNINLNLVPLKTFTPLNEGIVFLSAGIRVHVCSVGQKAFHFLPPVISVLCSS